MSDYVNKLAKVIVETKRAAAEAENATNTVAMVGTYHENGKETSVKVNGYSYPCSIASLDLNLVDGCRVMVIPSDGGGSMVIVGGGLP